MAPTTDEPRSWPADALGRLLDYVTASHHRAVAALLGVCLLAFLPGFFQIPPVDRDEARFAQATKQMVESGEYIDIRFQDEVRYKKPVGIYWLQAGVVKAAEALGVPRARTRIWLYRIPSLIGAIGAVLLTYWAALAFVSRRYAYLAALMLAGSVLLGVEARLAKTDAMLLLAAVAAMGALARAYLGLPEKDDVHRRVIMPAIFWTAIAGGILLKGPLILMFAGLAAVTLVIVDRSAHWLRALRPLYGVVWCAVLVLPWFLAIIDRAGSNFFMESVGRDMLSKVVSGQETHGAPPGFYLVLFWVTFWPAAPLAAIAAPGTWAARREPATRFLLAWVIPSWIVFELVVTKLPHYVLPLYPAIAILTALALERGVLSRSNWLRRATIWWPLIAVLVPILGIVAMVVLRRQLGFVAWPFAAGAMIFGFLAWRLFDEEGAERALLRATLASILLMMTVFGAIIPMLRPLFPSATLARALQDVGCANPVFAAAGYHEPSLVFLLGTTTRLTDGADAAEFLRQGPCRFALIEARQERAFVQRAEAIGLLYAPGPKLDGININGMRPLAISVYRSEAKP